MKNVRSFWLALASVVVMAGCGGGGSSSTTNDTTNTDITEADKTSAVIAGTVDTMLNMNLTELPGTTSTTGQAKSAALLSKVAMDSKSKLDIGVDTSYSCTNGGTIDISAADTGSYISMNYINCVEEGITLNGMMEMSSNEVGITMTFSNLVITDGTATVTYTSATVVLAGDANIMSISIEMTGSITIGSFSEQFTDIVYKETYNMTTETGSFSMDGMITSACLGDTVMITTITDIEFGNSCPTAGELQIEMGGSTQNVVFNSDMSVAIYVDGVLTETYANCMYFPDVEATCAI